MKINFTCCFVWAALGGLVVSVLDKGPMGLAAAGSVPAEDGGFLWVIKIRSAHFLRSGNKATGPMYMSEMLCRPNFPTPVSHP
jgi:hypothetical protein